MKVLLQAIKKPTTCLFILHISIRLLIIFALFITSLSILIDGLDARKIAQLIVCAVVYYVSRRLYYKHAPKFDL